MRADFYADYSRFEDWHWWFAGRRRILLAVLDHHLGAPVSGGGERRILDVGCGTGSMLAALGRYGVAEGVEPDEEAVRLCGERGLDRVTRADPPPLPFEDGSFDLVTAFDVLEHVDDDTELLREIRRMLRPAGSALVTVPAYRFLWGPQDEISHHRRRYTAGLLRDRAEAAGLTLDRVSYFNSVLFGPIAAVRVGRRLLPTRARRGEPRSDFEMGRPGVANRALTGAFGAEARVLAKRNLPFGVSILAVARNGTRS